MKIESIRCSLQVALLGAITDNLRAVRVIYKDNTMEVYFYYDQLPNEEEEELSEIVGTEVTTFYPEDMFINVVRKVIPAPRIIPKLNENEVLVFSRWEDI